MPYLVKMPDGITIPMSDEEYIIYQRNEELKAQRKKELEDFIAQERTKETKPIIEKAIEPKQEIIIKEPLTKQANIDYTTLKYTLGLRINQKLKDYLETKDKPQRFIRSLISKALLLEFEGKKLNFDEEMS